MFSLTISGATLEEFQAATAAFMAGGAVSGKTSKPTKAVTVTVKDDAAKAAAVANLAAAPTPPVAEPTPPAAAETPAPAASPAAAQPDLAAEVRALLTPLLKDNDKAPKVAALMAKYGATKLSLIKVDDLPAVLAEAKELA